MVFLKLGFLEKYFVTFKVDSPLAKVLFRTQKKLNLVNIMKIKNKNNKKKFVMVAFDMAQSSYWCYPVRSVDIFWYFEIYIRQWFETLEITYLHEVLWSKIKKNADSAPRVAKSYMSEYPLILEKKICTECYTQQEHFKIDGLFEFQDTVKCLEKIS